VQPSILIVIASRGTSAWDFSHEERGKSELADVARCIWPGRPSAASAGFQAAVGSSWARTRTKLHASKL